MNVTIPYGMKASPLLLFFGFLALLSGCQRQSRGDGSFSFRDLEVNYPGSLELSDVQEVPEKAYVSFFLTDKDDKRSRMEIGISEFAGSFLDTVPQEELMGELAAEVDDMSQKVLSLPDVQVLESSDIQWSEPPSFPEAFSFSKIQEDGETTYLAFSAKVIGNYCICSVCRSPDPSVLEVFNSILESISTKKSNP